MSACLEHTAQRGTHVDVNMHGACSSERGPNGCQHAWSSQLREGPTWTSAHLERTAQRGAHVNVSTLGAHSSERGQHECQHAWSSQLKRGAHMDVNTHAVLSSERWAEDFSFLVATASAQQTGQVQCTDVGWREQLCTFSVNLTLLCKVLI